MALGAKNAPTAEMTSWYMQIGAEITNACHEGYKRSKSGIAPESMVFGGNPEVCAYLTQPPSHHPIDLPGQPLLHPAP